MTREYIDGVMAIDAGKDIQQAANVTFSSELMENYATGRVLDGNRRHSIQAIRNSKGDPILFSLSTDHALYMIEKKADGTIGTGYIQTDITTPQLTEDLEILAFGIGQEDTTSVKSTTGKFTIAIAASDKRNPRVLHFYITEPLSNDSSKMNWKSAKDLWKPRDQKPFDTTRDKVNKILVGHHNMNTNHQASGPMVVCALQEDNAPNYYRIHASLNTPGRWEKLEIPVSSAEVIDVEIGKGPFAWNDGMYFLIKGPNRSHLIFSYLPVPRREQMHVHFYYPKGAQCLSVLSENEDGETGLYVGGAGAYHLPADKQLESNEQPGDFNVIAAPDLIPRSKKIMARQDDGLISVWTLDAIGKLWNSEAGKKEVRKNLSIESKQVKKVYRTADIWNKPLNIRNHVHDIAPMRNPHRRTNDLSLIEKEPGKHTKKGSLRLTHLTQDDTTSLWKGTDIPLQSTDRIQTFDCYTTQVTFADINSMPVADKAFNFTASEWCEVLVNGNTIELDPQKKVTLKTNSTGIITLAHKCDRLASPIYTLHINGEKTVINPLRKIEKGLKRLKNPKALKEEKKTDENGIETKLYQGSHNDEKLGKILTGVKNLQLSSSDLDNGGGVSDNYLSGLDPHHIKTPEIWGMSINTMGEIEYYEGDDVYLNMGSGTVPGTADREPDWFEKATRHIAGHIFEWIRNTAVKVFDFVVKRGRDFYEFAVKIGEEAYKFIIKCLGHVYNAMDWLLQKTLGISFEDIKQWVGFVFNLADVRRAHKVFAHVGKEIMGHVRANVDKVREQYVQVLTDLEKQAKEIKPVEHRAASQSVQAAQKESEDKIPAQQRGPLYMAKQSPIGSFGAHHLNSKPGDQEESMLFEEDVELANRLAPIIRILEKIKDDIKGFEGHLRNFMAGKMSLNDILTILSADIISTFLATIREIGNQIFKDIGYFLGKIDEFLNKSINIPVFTQLAQRILGVEKVTLLDIVLFPFLFPAVTLFKVINNRAPFKDGGTEITSKKGAALFAHLSAGKPEKSGLGVINVFKDWISLSQIADRFCSFAVGIGDIIAIYSSPVLVGFSRVVMRILSFIFKYPVGKEDLPNVILWIAELCGGIVGILFIIGKNAMPGLIWSLIVALVKTVVSAIKFIAELASGNHKPYQIARIIVSGVGHMLNLIERIALNIANLVKPNPWGKLASGIGGLAMVVQLGSGIASDVLNTLADKE